MNKVTSIVKDIKETSQDIREAREEFKSLLKKATKPIAIIIKNSAQDRRIFNNSKESFKDQTGKKLARVAVYYIDEDGNRWMKGLRQFICIEE